MADRRQNDLLRTPCPRPFNKQLSRIQSRVLTMGGLVEEQIDRAISALLRDDERLAATVIEEDLQVNALEVSIDEECTQLLACRQPKARDLRLLLTILKTVTDLERIGDEAKGIARSTLRLTAYQPSKSHLATLGPLAQSVKHLLRETLNVFARMDADAALGTTADDRHVDRKYANLLHQELDRMLEEPRAIPIALNLMWSARALERIGDRACNICEYVVYYVRGKTIRHTRKQLLGPMRPLLVHD